MTTLRAVFISLFLGLVAGASIVLGAAVVLPVAAGLEQRLHPPQSNWHVTDWQHEGKDVLLTGLVTKNRDCFYRPPPRARDEAGTNYLVDSTGRTKGLSWLPGPNPQRFGPWRVIGGAGKVLTFYQEFTCHLLWSTTVELGTLDTTKD